MSSKLLLGRYRGTNFHLLLGPLLKIAASSVIIVKNGFFFFYFIYIYTYMYQSRNDFADTACQFNDESIHFYFMSVVAHKLLLLAFWRQMPFCCCLLFLCVKLKWRTVYQNHVSSIKITLTCKCVHVTC